MNDRPDGSPQAPRPAAGWYRDPEGRPVERWWDGAQWDGQTRDLTDTQRVTDSPESSASEQNLAQTPHPSTPDVPHMSAYTNTNSIQGTEPTGLSIPSRINYQSDANELLPWYRQKFGWLHSFILVVPLLVIGNLLLNRLTPVLLVIASIATLLAAVLGSIAIFRDKTTPGRVLSAIGLGLSLVAVVVVAISITRFSSGDINTGLDMQKVEKLLSDRLSSAGVPDAQIACPTAVKANLDNTFRCVVTVPSTGERVTIEGRVTDKEGTVWFEEVADESSQGSTTEGVVSNQTDEPVYESQEADGSEHTVESSDPSEIDSIMSTIESEMLESARNLYKQGYVEDKIKSVECTLSSHGDIQTTFQCLGIVGKDENGEPTGHVGHAFIIWSTGEYSWNW